MQQSSLVRKQCTLFCYGINGSIILATNTSGTSFLKATSLVSPTTSLMWFLEPFPNAKPVDYGKFVTLTFPHPMLLWVTGSVQANSLLSMPRNSLSPSMGASTPLLFWSMVTPITTGSTGSLCLTPAMRSSSLMSLNLFTRLSNTNIIDI